MAALVAGRCIQQAAWASAASLATAGAARRLASAAGAASSSSSSSSSSSGGAQPGGDGSTFDPTIPLVCPLSKTPLRYDSATNELINDDLGVAYPIVGGIPRLVPSDGRLLDAAAAAAAAAAGQGSGGSGGGGSRAAS